MIIIVSDTSVISNLYQVDCLHILETLYSEIVIPTKVKEELESDKKSTLSLSDLSWIKIKSITDRKFYNTLIEDLDPGEAEAIVLAKELKAGLLMIDERKGRKIAQANGILIVGILGLLIEAKENSIITSVKPILDKLIYEIGFRVNPKLYNYILEQSNERK